MRDQKIYIYIYISISLSLYLLCSALCLLPRSDGCQPFHAILLYRGIPRTGFRTTGGLTLTIYVFPYLERKQEEQQHHLRSCELVFGRLLGRCSLSIRQAQVIFEASLYSIAWIFVYETWVNNCFSYSPHYSRFSLGSLPNKSLLSSPPP